MISFIVSAYDRPNYLVCCLASLRLQDPRGEIIVTLNHLDDEDINERCIMACDDFGAKWIKTGLAGATCCYSAAEMAVPQARGEWLCFPSEDSYYLPRFSEMMLRAAGGEKWDLVYCDILYSRPKDIAPFVLNAIPVVNHIDKTGFIVKREWFKEFPGKDPSKPVPADGLLIESLINRGIKHGLVSEPRGLDGRPPVLVVHN